MSTEAASISATAASQPAQTANEAASIAALAARTAQMGLLDQKPSSSSEKQDDESRRLSSIKLELINNDQFYLCDVLDVIHRIEDIHYERNELRIDIDRLSKAYSENRDKISELRARQTLLDNVWSAMTNLKTGASLSNEVKEELITRRLLTNSGTVPPIVRSVIDSSLVNRTLPIQLNPFGNGFNKVNYLALGLAGEELLLALCKRANKDYLRKMSAATRQQFEQSLTLENARNVFLGTRGYPGKYFDYVALSNEPPAYLKVNFVEPYVHASEFNSNYGPVALLDAIQEALALKPQAQLTSSTSAVQHAAVSAKR